MSKKRKEYKSIKVPEETYKDLKDLGKGIGKAVEVLVDEQKERFTEQIENIEGIADDLAEVIFESGIFDIKFKGMAIEEIEEVGDLLRIKGVVRVEIPNEDARYQIMTILKREETEDDEDGE